MKCKSCGNILQKPFLDYGNQPLPNAFLPADGKEKANAYPLKLYYCPHCHLVQLMETVQPEEIFHADYKYFSSYSEELLTKCKNFSGDIAHELSLAPDSRIIEIASNDGYQLQFFQELGFSNILGIEPTRSTANQAIAKGIPTLVEFFDRHTADKVRTEGSADLIIANNVIAHVPALNDFVSGIHALLAEQGTVVVEFQYLEDLVSGELFDLVYHEHYSYFSLHSITNVFQRHGLKIYKVQRTLSQGGSLRIYACRRELQKNLDPSVSDLLLHEKKKGLNDKRTYAIMAKNIQKRRTDLYQFLWGLKDKGKSIAAYGAPAKGNIFLIIPGSTTN